MSDYRLLAYLYKLTTNTNDIKHWYARISCNVSRDIAHFSVRTTETLARKTYYAARKNDIAIEPVKGAISNYLHMQADYY